MHCVHSAKMYCLQKIIVNIHRTIGDRQAKRCRRICHSQASRSLLGANKPDLKIPLLRHVILKEVRSDAFRLENGDNSRDLKYCEIKKHSYVKMNV